MAAMDVDDSGGDAGAAALYTSRPDRYTEFLAKLGEERGCFEVLHLCGGTLPLAFPLLTSLCASQHDIILFSDDGLSAKDEERHRAALTVVVRVRVCMRRRRLTQHSASTALTLQCRTRRPSTSRWSAPRRSACKRDSAPPGA